VLLEVGTAEEEVEEALVDELTTTAEVGATATVELELVEVETGATEVALVD